MTDKLVVIPVREESSRLPGKALLNETRHYLFEHTYYNIANLNDSYDTVIATDSKKIIDICEEKGIDYIKTGKHWCGTNRVAEAARNYYHKTKYVINLQVDYPLIDPDVILRMFEYLEGSEAELISCFYTLLVPSDENYVKAILNFNHSAAIWFSRKEYSPYIHVGIYGFVYEFLQLLTVYEQTDISYDQHLEQLTWLQRIHKLRIPMFKILPTLAINTREDYDIFKHTI